MAELLNISRQQLTKVAPLLQHDRMAVRHGRLWRYHREQVLKHYDVFVNWRSDSPRDAVR